MRIERVNDNQIRCFLTKDDLIARHMNISELAYGTEKARGLFNEMMTYAYDQCGFEIENFPLMIEAIPLSSDSIVLIVTKIAIPDDWNSKYDDTEPIESGDFGFDDEFKSFDMHYFPAADEIIAECESKDASAHIYRIYSFDSIDDIIDVAKLLDGKFFGYSDLYRDNMGLYYLAIHMSDHTPAEFNKICNLVSEYCLPSDITTHCLGYLKEHGTSILNDHALFDLALL